MYALKPRLHERERAHEPGRLRTVAIDVTPVCNMKCAHCYAETFVSSTPVALGVLQQALDELYELGVFHVVLQGGEPIADPRRLEAILSMVHPDETYINCVSNGYSMSKDMIAWLKARKVDKLTFSLDSGIEAEHDAARRPGSYRRVLAAVDETLGQGLLASVSTVVTRGSLRSEGFRTVYEFAIGRGIRLDIQVAEPVGNWDGRTGDLITPEDAAYLKELQQQSPRLPTGLLTINRDIYRGGRDHCPAGIEFLSITTDGHVLPCNFVQFSLGRIGELPIRHMRAALMKSRWFDGTSPVCPPGESREFIERHITPRVGQPKPLDAYDVLELERPE